MTQRGHHPYQIARVSRYDTRSDRGATCGGGTSLQGLVALRLRGRWRRPDSKQKCPFLAICIVVRPTGIERGSPHFGKVLPTWVTLTARTSALNIAGPKIISIGCLR